MYRSRDKPIRREPEWSPPSLRSPVAKRDTTHLHLNQAGLTPAEQHSLNPSLRRPGPTSRYAETLRRRRPLAMELEPRSEADRNDRCNTRKAAPGRETREAAPHDRVG